MAGGRIDHRHGVAMAHRDVGAVASARQRDADRFSEGVQVHPPKHRPPRRVHDGERAADLGREVGERPVRREHGGARARIHRELGHDGAPRRVDDRDLVVHFRGDVGPLPVGADRHALRLDADAEGRLETAAREVQHGGFRRVFVRDPDRLPVGRDGDALGIGAGRQASNDRLPVRVDHHDRVLRGIGAAAHGDVDASCRPGSSRSRAASPRRGSSPRPGRARCR